MADFFDRLRAASKERESVGPVPTLVPLWVCATKLSRGKAWLTNFLNRSGGLPTHRGGAEVAEGHVIVGASATSFPNSSGANARTVVVRAFPDDVIAAAN